MDKIDGIGKEYFPNRDDAILRQKYLDDQQKKLMQRDLAENLQIGDCVMTEEYHLGQVKDIKYSGDRKTQVVVFFPEIKEDEKDITYEYSSLGNGGITIIPKDKIKT